MRLLEAKIRVEESNATLLRAGAKREVVKEEADLTADITVNEKVSRGNKDHIVVPARVRCALL